jgi:site-specific DNA recombinase
MNTETKRAAIYARVSSDRQDVDLSISAQLRSLREYAAKNNLVVVREFVDEAESGRTSARPAFRGMISLAKLKQKPFEVILVWKLNRFARNREDSIIYKSLLRRQGIQVISINELLEPTPAGRMLEGIIEVLDEFYSANLAQDVTRGMRESASRGYFSGGKPPYGYNISKVRDGHKMRSTLVPNTVTAPVIRRMFEECQSGKGTREIARGLDSDGITTPNGKRWVGTAVLRILYNEAYIGTLVWGKRSGEDPVKVENAWPPLIDKDTFSKVNSFLKSRSPKIVHPRRTVSEYLFSGLMKCGTCGGAMSGHSAKSGQFFYYRCSNASKRGAKACPGRWIPKSWIESFIIEKIRNCILSDDNILELVQLTTEDIEESLGTERQTLHMIEKQVADVDMRLEHLYDALETRSFSVEELAPRIKKLQSKRADLMAKKYQAEGDLQSDIVTVPDLQIVQDYVDDLKTLLDSSPIVEQRTFLKTFIEGIEMRENDFTIDFTLPMPPNNLKSEVFGVLPFDTNSRPCRSRTCDPLIKSQGVSNQRGKEVK